MSDRDLQTLRRAVAATGAPSDRAALLRARVRAGELAVERVELAAFLGDEAARLFVDPDHQVGTYFHLPPTPDRPHGIHGDGVRLDEWAADLGRWANAGPAPSWVLVLAVEQAASKAYQANEPCKESGCEGGECAWCERAWNAVRLVTATLAARPAVGRMILEAEAASRLRCDVPRLVPGAEARCRPPVALSVGGTAFCAAHWPADAAVAPRSPA